MTVGRSSLLLEQVEPDPSEWRQMDAFSDRHVFQTREWLSFIEAEQKADPVVCAVKAGSSTVGYFTGLVVRHFGVRILGSPFPGWSTGYMGFNLENGISRREAVDALVRFAFGPLQCAHVEVRDRYLDSSAAQRLGGTVHDFATFEVDLRGSEDEIFGRMTSACRRCIRKAQKVGVVIEEAGDVEFADEYQEQLQDVFAKQSLRPTYGVERVRALIEHLQPTGRLLLLRARNAEGKCIATAIFVVHGRMMYFWGGASWRQDQILRPNESIFWYAMRYGKREGAEVLDMGGGGDYKRKYGGDELIVPHVVRSRIRGLQTMRELARQLHDPGGILNRVARIARRSV